MKQVTIDALLSSSPSVSSMHRNIITPSDYPHGEQMGSDRTLRAQITAAFETHTWDWSSSETLEWRQLFYEELLRRSHMVSPLTMPEAEEYLQSLVSLPSQGFFPRPDIAAKSLSLTHHLISICPPVPAQDQASSTRCAPSEHSADARVALARNSLLGFHTGWLSERR